MARVGTGGIEAVAAIHDSGNFDHRAGDSQFERVGGVQLVPADLQLRKYFGFDAWPNGSAQIDLGDRILDVLPAPGHHPAQLVYYDRNTGWFSSATSCSRDAFWSTTCSPPFIPTSTHCS